MTTIGDVFSIVAAILGGMLTLWAAILGAGLLFPDQSARAKAALADSRSNFGRGLVVLLVLGVLSIIMVNAALPFVKGIGFLLMIWLVSLSILGTSGVVRLVAQRIQDQDPMMSAYAATVRGAAILAGGSLLPLVGWFGFAPVLMIVSIGAGWKALVPALVRRRRAEAI